MLKENKIEFDKLWDTVNKLRLEHRLNNRIEPKNTVEILCCVEAYQSPTFIC